MLYGTCTPLARSIEFALVCEKAFLWPEMVKSHQNWPQIILRGLLFWCFMITRIHIKLLNEDKNICDRTGQMWFKLGYHCPDIISWSISKFFLSICETSKPTVKTKFRTEFSGSQWIRTSRGTLTPEVNFKFNHWLWVASSCLD